MIGLQTGFNINPYEGQKYSDSFSGLQVDREVNFKYYHIPLMLRIRGAMSNGENPAMIGFSLGAQYDMLRSANEDVSYGSLPAAHTDIKDRIHKSDIGIILNIETDIYFSSFLYMTFGINSSVSNDINASGWAVNDNYKKSHDLLIGLNLGLSYYIKN